jgi:acetyl esterase/lipase
MSTIEDIQYSGSDGDADKSGHLLDLYLPKATEPVPVVIWTMGSGFTAPAGRIAGDIFSRQFGPHGYAVAAVAVRGSGQAQFPAQQDDTLDAVSFLRRNAATYGLDAGRFAYVGHSSGGWSAAVAGTQGSGDSAVQAAIALSSPTDIGNMDRQALPDAAHRVAVRGPGGGAGLNSFDGRHEAAESPEGRLIGGRVSAHPGRAAAASPALHVTPDGPPFLIVHGTEDEYVPFAQGTTLYTALQAAGRDVTFVTLSGGNHLDAIPPWNLGAAQSATRAHSRNGEPPVITPVIGDGWSVLVDFVNAHLRA